MDKKRKIINIAFIAIIMLVLVTGLGRTLLGTVDFLEYENRNAEKVKAFSFSSYADGSFQDSVEAALSDQIEFASVAKQAYNNVRSVLIQTGLKPFAGLEYEDEDSQGIIIDDNSDIGGESQKNPADPGTDVTGPAVILPEDDPGTAEPKEETPSAVVFDPDNVERGEAGGGRYQSVGGGLNIYQGYVVQGVALFNANKPRFDNYAAAFNKLVENHPELKFYMYYIERDSDQNYASGYRNGIYDYLTTIFDLPAGRMDCQRITSFEQYKEYNMRSDHHWSYKGSYEGYKDIIKMMRPLEKPLEPLDELKVGYTKGSFTKNSATANIKDDFYIYEFGYPDFYITVGGKEKQLGTEAECIARAREGNDGKFVLYGDVYGGDIGEIKLYNPDGAGTLLMFGNSYDNAVIKLLASHFEYTYSIDLRYYKNVTGKDFSFDEYVEKVQPNDVLVMGSAYYYLQSPFIIK